MVVLRLVRECDMFRKVRTEHQNEVEALEVTPSLVLRLLSIVLIAVLGLSETWNFLTPVRKQQFDIDMGETQQGHQMTKNFEAMGITGEGPASGLFTLIGAGGASSGTPKKMRVHLDMTVYGFPCIDLSLDYQDVMGTRAVDVKTTVFKQRLHQNGSAVDTEHLQNDPKAAGPSGGVAGLSKNNNTNSTCKTCYGALPDSECCNSCSDVLYAYRLKRWALPRIEDIEQCRHDGTAKSAYQPPQIIHLGDYSSDDYLPKFTKLSHLSSSAKEPRITTPFRMNMSLASLKPLSSLTPFKSSSPFVLNFSGLDLGDDDFDDDGFDDDLFGTDSKDKAVKNASTKVLKWPSCVQRNVIIHGYDIGEALMIDLSKHGAKTGCWNNDCSETDKFGCDTMEECAEMCQKVEACQWWTFGDEEKTKKCWIRTGRHGREKRYGFSSGARGCSQNSTSNATASSEANKSDAAEVKSEAKDDGTVKTQPRRLMSFEDDFAPFYSRPYGGGLNFGPNPHMPIFGMGYGMGYDSKENQMRREQKGESCRIYGYFDTNKVPGNFHIGTHGTMAPSYLSYFDEPREPAEQNMRHTINRLAFVDVLSNKTLAEKQPLDGFESPKAFTFQYYITVNPATVINHDRKVFGRSHDGYQYRAGSFVTNELIGPAVFFRFDLDPIRVTYYTDTVSWTTWMTNMCAVIGGCIALSSMLEQMLEATLAAALSKD